jgi:thioredoxin 1
VFSFAPSQPQQPQQRPSSPATEQQQQHQPQQQQQRNSVLYQSSIASPTSSQQQQQLQQDYATLKRRDIVLELQNLGVSYRDCFDRESLVNRLIEVREQTISVFSPSPTVSATTATATATVLDAPASASPTIDAQQKMAELRGKTMKDLKLECSRRNIRYGKFLEKEDFVQAVWNDLRTVMAFSATGLVRPGVVTEVSGEQLDVEMNSHVHNSNSMILVDVYATWCGPCRMVVPQLEAASKALDTKVRVVKLDSDKNHAWAGRYQVQGLPTMLLIKDGRVIDRLEGAHMSNSIVDFVNKHMS